MGTTGTAPAATRASLTLRPPRRKDANLPGQAAPAGLAGPRRGHTKLAFLFTELPFGDEQAAGADYVKTFPSSHPTAW